jgi:hypothetical protein
MGILDGMEDDEQALVRPRKDIEIFGREKDETAIAVRKAVAGVYRSGGNWVKGENRLSAWREIEIQFNSV